MSFERGALDSQVGTVYRDFGEQPSGDLGPFLPVDTVASSNSLTPFTKACDVIFVAASLPLIFVLSLFLLVANPILNPGPLFFRQERMGQNGRPFMLWKFRSMRMPTTKDKSRGADAPLEHARITALGQLLRKTHIDELPNAFSILTGHMSLVGPRPDALDYAQQYLRTVPAYHQRLQLRPGITGLAQVRDGYADTPRFIRRKARFDAYYVRNRSGLLDARIILATIAVCLFGTGAK